MSFGTHTVLKTSYEDKQDPTKFGEILLGMGCFWGAERKFWQMPREIVYSTAVGYSGGSDNPENGTYKAVCSGKTNHSEVVKVIYHKDEEILNLKKILKIFWESHDPTQGNRQGNDIGSQYRSSIYCENEDDLNLANESLEVYQNSLNEKSINKKITTEVGLIKNFFYGEDYHQQYLDKNPGGYCGLKGSGVSCPYGTK